MTMNNELWMFLETSDPNLFYAKVVEHFENRRKDSQAFDMKQGLGRAVLQALSDKKSRPLIDYFQSDDFGKRPLDQLNPKAIEDFPKLLSGEVSLKGFVEKLSDEVGVKLKPEAQILLALWQQVSKTKDLSELANLSDVILVPGILEADRESYLRRVFPEESERELFHGVASIQGKSSSELMTFLLSKKVKLPPEVRQHLQAEILKLEAREKRRTAFFSAGVKASKSCSAQFKKMGKKKS
jgi:hypothetical protein